MKWPRKLTTEQDHDQAVARAYELDTAGRELSDHEQNELTLLDILLDKYEKKNYPAPVVEPHRLIQFQMEGHGLNNKDLTPILGDPGTVSKVVSGKRPVPRKKISALADLLKLHPSQLSRGRVEQPIISVGR